MGIPNESLDELEALGTPATILGYTIVDIPGNIISVKLVELEVTLEIPLLQNMFLSAWIKVPAAIIETRPGAPPSWKLSFGSFPAFCVLHWNDSRWAWPSLPYSLQVGNE